MLSFVMLLSMSILIHAEEKTVKNGDIIKFGNYPQSLVTDTKLIKKLDKTPKKWKSYDYIYYEKTGDSYFDDELNATVYYTEKKSSDRMQYSDFIYENQKYRAVSFIYGGGGNQLHYPDEQRFPREKEFSWHGVYYFTYEPIDWVVLDSEAGLVASLYSLDSQEYNFSSYYYDETAKAYYGSGTGTYLNDYLNSSVRKWLNSTFMNTAFTAEQIGLIERNNYALDKYSYIADQCFALDNTANDFVTIPTYNEFRNQVNYSIVSTDYAACQGYVENSFVTRTILPSTGFSTGNQHIEYFISENDGAVPSFSSVWNVDGIVPMLMLSSLTDNVEISQHNNESAVCRCVCHNLIHSNNVVVKFFFRLLEGLWELFSTKEYCDCGLRHY